MNAAQAMDRVIDDLNLPKPKPISLADQASIHVERLCLQLFGRVGVADLERLLFLGEIVLRERRAALLDIQREEDEDGSLAHYHSCER